MPLTPVHNHPWAEADIRAGGNHDESSRQLRRVLQHHFALSHLDRALAVEQLRSHLLRQCEKVPCCSRRIDHGIVGNAQCTNQSLTQAGLRLPQCPLIQHFSLDPALRIGLSLREDLLHLLIVSGNPQRAAFFKLDPCGKCVLHLAPEITGVVRQCKLRGRIVHHHQVPHSSGARSIGRHSRLHDSDAQSRRGTLVRARRADNACSENDCVVHLHQNSMPPAKGSSCSKSSSDSPVIHARPRIVGRTASPCARIVPTKCVPRKPSCRQTCPSDNLPSA